MLAYEHYIYATLALVGTALAVLGLALVLRHERSRARLEPLAQMTPSLLTILGLLFGLTLAFIANDTWTSRARASDAVLREADGLRALSVMAAEQAPMLGLSIGDSIREYGHALVNEWPSLSARQRDQAVTRAGDRLLDTVASAAVARSAGPNMQALMLDKVLELRADHDLRVNLAQTHLNPLKWTGMAFLGLVTLIGLAALHLDKPKSGIAAMILFATAAAPEAAIVLVQGNPFQAPVAVSAQPLSDALRLAAP